MLTIRGPNLPGGELSVWYLEAFCRPGSARRDWKETVIPHRTRLVEVGRDGRLIRLRSELADGVVVDHEIRAGDDEVDFRLVATNPRQTESQAHWAQPCIRVDRFTGAKSERASEAYLPSCFIFVADRLTRLPAEPWAREARYTLKLADEYLDAFEVEVRELMDTVTTNARFEQIVREEFPIPDDATKRVAALREQRRDAVLGLWKNDPRVGDFRETGWGAVQAFSTWEEHERTVRGSRAERRALRSISGSPLLDEVRAKVLAV